MKINFEQLQYNKPIKLDKIQSFSKNISSYLQENQQQSGSNHLNKSQQIQLYKPCQFIQTNQKIFIIQQQSQTSKLPKSDIQFINRERNNQIQKQKRKKCVHNLQKFRGQAEKQEIEKKRQQLHHIRGEQMNTRQIKGDKYMSMASRVYNIKDKKIKGLNLMKADRFQMTLQPVLNYTMNSKAKKKIEKKRKDYFTKKNINVFHSLYIDAEKYASKRQLQTIILHQQEKSISQIKTNHNNINSTFQQRLQQSIKKQSSIKIKSQNKIQFDQTTGKRFFIPDTTNSKISYFSHFKLSHCCKSLDKEIFTARPNHYSKDSQEFGLSQQKTTIVNYSCQELRRPLCQKRFAIEKHNDFLMKRIIKIAQIYCSLIWSKDQIKKQYLSLPQQKILKTFLTQIKKYENIYSNNVSQQVFIAYFKDFYQTLNLYDKQVIDQRLKVITKMQRQEKQKYLNQMKQCINSQYTHLKTTYKSNKLDYSNLYLIV